MKRLWQALAAVLSGAIVVWAVVAGQPAQDPAMPSLLPEGALLYIHSPDFHALLSEWNSSAEKRAWLTSDNYAVFSQSRLFTRLAQAQSEFSAAATIPTATALLNGVAGKESCLALYDIGKLEFVYVTRMDAPAVESTPLWQMRSRFEQRAEAGTQFFVREDPQSKRVAAFAAKNGWLILATREDLLAGVLDRMQGAGGRSLSEEKWYVDAVHQAASQPGDLRMVLNLVRIVPSPYFRSYWVQQNITEMKQYSAAVSDLYRNPEVWREERVLLRKSAAAIPATGVGMLRSIAPADATFWSVRAVTDATSILTKLRCDLLDPQPKQLQMQPNAPPAAVATQAGSASDLETRIDQAPQAEMKADPWQPLRAFLITAQPSGLLQVFSMSAPRDDTFISFDQAMVLSSAQQWDDSAVRNAISATLGSNLTAGKIGAEWEQRTGAGGTYYEFSGQIKLLIAVRGERLFLANSADLLQVLLANDQKSKAPESAGKSVVTYAAVFQHNSQDQTKLRALTSMLDRAGNRGAQDNGGPPHEGESPAFFSGNLASFSRVFSTVSRETVEERDKGATVEQTVQYDWNR